MKKHHDKYFQLGLNIAYYRKLHGYTQLELAEKVGISRTHMGNVEAPNVDCPLSLEKLFDIADILEATPSQLLEFRNQKRPLPYPCE